MQKTMTVLLSLCVRWTSNADALGSGLEMRMSIVPVATLIAVGFKLNPHCEEVADIVAIDFLAQ